MYNRDPIDTATLDKTRLARLARINQTPTDSSLEWDIAEYYEAYYFEALAYLKAAGRAIPSEDHVTALAESAGFVSTLIHPNKR